MMQSIMMKYLYQGSQPHAKSLLCASDQQQRLGGTGLSHGRVQLGRQLCATQYAAYEVAGVALRRDKAHR